MKTCARFSACLLILLAALAPAEFAAAPAASQPSALNETLRKVAARYARTEARIEQLVGRRLKPQPLPDSLPNPFSRGPDLAALGLAEPEPVPAAPDLSDEDTLARLVPTLRITGLVILNQQPHLTINQIVCKAGDLIPVGGRDTPVFIQVRKISNDQVTLGLNEAEITIPVRL